MKKGNHFGRGQKLKRATEEAKQMLRSLPSSPPYFKCTQTVSDYSLNLGVGPKHFHFFRCFMIFSVKGTRGSDSWGSTCYWKWMVDIMCILSKTCDKSLVKAGAGYAICPKRKSLEQIKRKQIARDWKWKPVFSPSMSLSDTVSIFYISICQIFFLLVYMLVTF